jgi:hypothetical protein
MPEIKTVKYDIPEPKKGRKPFGYWRDKYKPEYADIASRLAAVGFTEKDIAHTLGVTDTAIKSWKHSFDSFREACENGKHDQLKRMAAKAMLESVGYDYQSKKTRIIKDTDGNIQKIEETVFDNHQSPNPNLILFLMCNLSSQLGLEGIDAWKSRQKMEIENRNINLTISGELVSDQINKLAGRLLGESETKQVESKIVDNE